MIGHPRVVLAAVAVGLYAAVHVVLAVMSAHKVSGLVPYYAALVLAVAACAAVLVPSPPGLATAVAVAVAAGSVAATLLVVRVLPEARPSYAMWYPSLLAVPMAGLVLRGHPALGVGGALAGAAVTLSWTQEGAGLVEGLYRVTTPTAVVLLSVGVAVLMRTSRADVERAHAERAAAAEFASAVRAAEAERADRIADVSRLAAPVLTRLADGEVPGRRLVKECRLLESTLRDGIRGRGLVDASVATAAWAARARGVRVVLLDDAGGEAPGASPDDAAAEQGGRRALRSAVARILEAVSSGTVTARLAPRAGPVGEAGGGDAATAPAVAPDAVHDAVQDTVENSLQDRVQDTGTHADADTTAGGPPADEPERVAAPPAGPAPAAPPPVVGTVVVVSPEAADAAAAVPRRRGVAVDLTEDELVVTVSARA